MATNEAAAGELTIRPLTPETWDAFANLHPAMSKVVSPR
jgi:hypothetical protein